MAAHFLAHGVRVWTWRVARWLLPLLVMVGIAIAVSPSFAQSPSPTGNKVDGYPVVLDNKTLFFVRDGIPGVVTAQERAQVITQRLNQVATDPTFTPDQFRVQEADQESIILAGETVIFTIRDADARSLDQSRQVLAGKALQLIKTSVSHYREDRSLRQVIQGIVLAVLSTMALLLFWKALQTASFYAIKRIRAAGQAGSLNWRVLNFRVLGSNALRYLLTNLIRLIRFVLILAALYLYLPFFLSQFPATKVLGNSLLSIIGNQFQAILDQFVRYLPNLIIIVIIVFITNYVIEFAKLVISELGRDDVYPWFYPEWIDPTTRLASIGVIATACVIAAPYLPGFGSPAFQGVSLFLGALFTLGSSSAVANAIAGIILIYTRAFRIGDVVRIGTIQGTVMDKSLFVTRVASFKQEVITIPNASVLNGDVTNFSVIQRERQDKFLVLHTTITLGYDLPWRKVHNVLIEAAKATPHILSEPSPFVLQTSLNDFHVSYEINAFTDSPEQMPAIYSKLHENIQDYCNQADIEILSPGFTALRDGNHSTIPADYLPADYESPAFRVQTGNGNS